MRAVLAFILILIAHVVSGQTIEQKAVDYLVANINEVTIKYSDGESVFNGDSSNIWYEEKVRGDKPAGKISLESFSSVTEEVFYKVIHPAKDIFIITYKKENDGEKQYVRFDIVSNYRNYTKCTVVFDANEIPVRIEQKTE